MRGSNFICIFFIIPCYLSLDLSLEESAIVFPIGPSKIKKKYKNRVTIYIYWFLRFEKKYTSVSKIWVKILLYLNEDKNHIYNIFLYIKSYQSICFLLNLFLYMHLTVQIILWAYLKVIYYWWVFIELTLNLESRVSQLKDFF